MPIPFYACMVAAATTFHLPVHALPAIQRAEGGWIGAVQPNKDGSHDLGLMQVNTRWIKPLSGATGLPAQTVATRLILEPCFNITMAAFILRNYVDEEHGNMWQAIGDYHSHTPGLNTAYKFRVMQEASNLPPVPSLAPHIKPHGKKHRHRKPEALAAD
jgi:soluble lytic murein transglycosylase-like protein